MRTYYFLVLFFSVGISSCFLRPTKADIEKKLLKDYGCSDAAEINGLKILRTEERKTTDLPRVIIYTVGGEIEWAAGCREEGLEKLPGQKEAIRKSVLFTETTSGWQ